MDDNQYQNNDIYNGEQLSMPGYVYSGQATAAPDSNNDPGEQDAKLSMIFGIISFLPIVPFLFSALGIIKYNEYQKKGNGSHQSDAKIGKTCSVISLVIQCVSIVVATVMLILSAIFMVNTGSKLIDKSREAFDNSSGYFEEFDDDFFSQDSKTPEIVWEN